MIKHISIYDMDGCVVDSTHRYRTMRDASGIERIDLEYWRAHEHCAYFDALLPLADQYKAQLRDPSHYVVIATARALGDADHAFILDKLGRPDHIIARKGHADKRKGGELKANGLAKLFALRQFRGIPATYYEDNTDYLRAVCLRFPHIHGVHVPSKQAH